MKLTQAQLAERLDTTQQTIARWERGDVEPSLSKLREVALELGVSTQYLLDGGEEKPQSTRYHLFAGRAIDGYWGNLGVRLEGQLKSKWYPITVSEMKRAYRNVQSAETFVVSTLNNRCLLINRANVQSFYFLDEAADHVEGDWEVGPDDVEGEPQDFYRAILPILEKDPAIAQDYTRSYRAYCLRVFRRFGLTRDQMIDLVLGSRIHLKSGQTIEGAIEPKDMNQLHFDFDIETDSEFIKIGMNYGEMNAFFSMKSISMIDLSLVELVDAKVSEGEE